MLIDWFTVGAQGLNFLILLWLMKRFLYRPILKAIDAREKKLADELAQAQTKQAEAKNQSDEFKRKNEEFDRTHDQRLAQSLADVGRQQADLLDEARKEVEGLRLRQHQALRDEQKSLSKDVQTRAQEEIFGIARKVLSDLAGITLEAQIIELFMVKIRLIQTEDKEAFVKALAHPDDLAVIGSRFEISPDLRLRLEAALQAVFNQSVSVRYETGPTLVAGIELSAGGHRIAWSISDYLTSLGHRLDDVLKLPTENDQKSQSVTTPAPAAS